MSEETPLTKPWYKSRTIWIAILGVVIEVIQKLANLPIPDGAASATGLGIVGALRPFTFKRLKR
jgi:hypothetical protein